MKAEIEVWFHYIADFENPVYTIYMNGVDEIFREKINTYKFVSDKVKRLTGRLMLQKAVEESKIAINLTQNLSRNKYNKPFIKNGYEFNLSYSGQLVTLAFSKIAPLGIDVEHCKDFNYQSMLSQFNENEQNYILQHPTPLEAFYHLWVKKESLVKAEGIGLTDELNKLDCSGKSNNYFNKKWHFKRLNIKSDYICYLCSNFITDNIKISEIGIAKLIG